MYWGESDLEADAEDLEADAEDLEADDDDEVVATVVANDTREYHDRRTIVLEKRNQYHREDKPTTSLTTLVLLEGDVLYEEYDKGVLNEPFVRKQLYTTKSNDKSSQCMCIDLGSCWKVTNKSNIQASFIVIS